MHIPHDHRVASAAHGVRDTQKSAKVRRISTTGWEFLEMRYTYISVHQYIYIYLKEHLEITPMRLKLQLYAITGDDLNTASID